MLGLDAAGRRALLLVRRLAGDAMSRPVLACNSDVPHEAHAWSYETGPPRRRHWRRCPGVDASRPAVDDWQDFGLARRDDGVYICIDHDNGPLIAEVLPADSDPPVIGVKVYTAPPRLGSEPST